MEHKPGNISISLFMAHFPVLAGKFLHIGIVTADTLQGNASILINRIRDTIPVSLCLPIGSETIVNVQAATTYQWQVDTGARFIYISDNANYNGTNTANM